MQLKSTPAGRRPLCARLLPSATIGPTYFFLTLLLCSLFAVPCKGAMVEFPTTRLNANLSDEAFERMVRNLPKPPGTEQLVFRDIREYVIPGLSVRSDTKRVADALQQQGDIRPRMVYAVLMEQPPAPGSGLHSALKMLAERHNALGVICGTFADNTMGTERLRPLQMSTTLPDMKRMIQVDVRNTTWGQGRNRMLHVALEVFPSFEYIAMADDDTMAELRCCLARPDLRCADLLREFKTPKRTPMEVPAQELCVSSMERHIGAVRPRFAGLFRTWGDHNPLVDAVMDQAIAEGGSAYQSISWSFADAIFNVFSREAIELDGIIPYNEEVEKTSWWLSQAIVNLRLLCKYGRSESIMATATVAPYNDKHRDYPRGLPLDLPDYLQALQDLKDPVKCPMRLNAGRS